MSIPKEQFFSKVSTVAYAPLPQDDSPENRRFIDKVGSYLASALASRRITLKSDSPWNQCWQSGSQRAGGLYNPKDGSFNEEKATRLRWECTQQVAAATGVEALVEVELLLSNAPMTDNVVRWHGVEEDLLSFGDRFWAAGTYNGTMPVLSLRVRIISNRGALLYDNAGGIEVASDYRDGKFVPKQGLLKDDQKIRHAVGIALRRLLERDSLE